jgi:N-acylneuraminate cytidylyltransferase
MEVLAIIPARGGSKSIPKKSIYPILGKPLLAYSIQSALESDQISRAIVTTDDEEIAAVARKYDADVPFIRPKELAGDTVLDLPVFQHALKWLKENEDYTPDLVVHLWPTSPYRRKGDLDKAIDMIWGDNNATCVRSITYPSQPPFKMWRRDKGKYLTPLLQKEYADFYAKNKEPHAMPRQILPEVMFQSGYLSVIRPSVILEENSMHGGKILPFFHDPDIYTEVDSYKDLNHTEYILKKKLKEKILI